jgi:hypothetical protein
VKFLITMTAGEVLDRLIQRRVDEGSAHPSADRDELEQIAAPLLNDARLDGLIHDLTEAHQILARGSANVRQYGAQRRLGSSYIAIATGMPIYEDERERLIHEIDRALED